MGEPGGSGLARQDGAMTDKAQTTHAAGCYAWGPRQYDCALAEIERLLAVIKEHNDGLADVCAALEERGHPCAKYRAIRPGKRCPDCPRNNEILDYERAAIDAAKGE